ncbi:MAG TPA: HEAT repeat domain-containing protein, partial [Allosphingosinicella sp.]
RRVGRALPRADAGVRLLYCELLAEMGGEEAVGVLEGALGDRSPAVRIGAGIALAELGAAPEIGALLQRLGPETHTSSRLAILFAWLLPAEERAVALIAADSGAAPRLRLSALDALRIARRPVYGRLLAALAGDAQVPVAAQVARALAGDRSQPGSAALAGLLAHPAPEVRREAARSAGADGPELRRLLVDRDPAVASAAARTVWMLNPGPVQPALGAARRPPIGLLSR